MKCGCDLVVPKSCYADVELKPGVWKRMWAVLCRGCWPHRLKHGPRLREKLTCG